MKYKKTQSVFDLYLQLSEDIPLEISLDLPGNPKIILRAANEEEKGDAKAEKAICISEITKNPSNKNMEIFQLLSEGKLPKDMVDSKGIDPEIADDQGNLKGGRYPNLDLFPDHFKQFVLATDKLLGDIADKTVHVVRWRMGSRGEHGMLRGLQSEYSLNGNSWFPVPRNLVATVEGHSVLEASAVAVNEIGKLVSSGKTEPVAHNLWNEAWTQRSMNPRSAIVLGVSAAETAIKSYIAEVAPETEWLIRNLQSPPILRLYADYLRELVHEDSHFPYLELIDEERLALLKKGIQARNTVVHAGDYSLRARGLEDILVVIKDFLWIIDMLSGYSWAEEDVGRLATQVGEAITFYTRKANSMDNT